MVVPPPADAVGPVQEVCPITRRRFGVLVDGDDDRLDVLVAPTLARGPVAHLCKRVQPGRIVRVVVVPAKRHRLPNGYQRLLFCSWFVHESRLR